MAVAMLVEQEFEDSEVIETKDLAVTVPGGYAPDKMRMRHAMVALVRDVAAAGKPLAAICHGLQVLISAGVLRGRTVTCWPSIAIDVRRQVEPMSIDRWSRTER